MKYKEVLPEDLLTLHKEDKQMKEFNLDSMLECGNGFIRYTEDYREPRYDSQEITHIIGLLLGEQFTIISSSLDCEAMTRIYVVRSKTSIVLEKARRAQKYSTNTN